MSVCQLLVFALLGIFCLPDVSSQPEPHLMMALQEPPPADYDPQIARSRITLENCPLYPPCCEMDCCGQGTEWFSPYCYPSPGSTGFIGVYPDEYEFGCVKRVCCEQDCCGEGTIYDPMISYCIPTDEQEETLGGSSGGPGQGLEGPGGGLGEPDEGGDERIDGGALAPEIGLSPAGEGMYYEEIEVGDGSLGTYCYVDDDCNDGTVCSESMFYGGPGYCTCNANTNAGCEGEYVCFQNLERTQLLADALPGCYLPFNASCLPAMQYSCVTGVCDKKTSRCACNPRSQYPCLDDGTVCVHDEEEGHICVTEEEAESYQGIGTEGDSEPIVLGPPEPRSDCPRASDDVICTAEYAPVDCGGCIYSNQCQATAALSNTDDESFASVSCEPVTPELPTVLGGP